jgi:FK506-binding nuclear protein
MSVAFWSAAITAGKPVEVQPPEGYVLNIQNAAVTGKGTDAVVLRAKTISIEGDEIDAVLCTLRPTKTDQCSLQLVFSYDVPIKFHITGDKSMELHLSGYYQPAPDDDDEDDEDMYGDEDDSEDDEIMQNTMANAAGGKLVVEDVGGEDEDSSEDDSEEDGVDAAFIQKMIAQQRGGQVPAVADDSEEDSEEDDSEEDDSEEDDSEDDSEESEDEAPPPAKAARVEGKGSGVPKTPQGSAQKPKTPQQQSGSKPKTTQQQSGSKPKTPQQSHGGNKPKTPQQQPKSAGKGPGFNNPGSGKRKH